MIRHFNFNNDISSFIKFYQYFILIIYNFPILFIAYDLY